MSAQKVVFCFEVPNISRRIDTNKFSTKVCVWNVPWEIQVWKVVNVTAESLGIKLLCLYESNEDWSYATTVTYRLCSFDEEVQAFECEIHPKVVNNVDSSISTNSFIEWNDLNDTEKQYVEDDTIKIEFVIEVANPNLLVKSVLQFKEVQSLCLTNLELSIKNTNNLLVVKSPNFNIQNEQYFLNVYKYKQHLDVELCQVNDAESSNQPTMLVKLISEKGDGTSVVQHSQFHTEKLISWKELRKPENGFNYDDEIKFEVKIMADAVFQEAKEFIQTILSAGNVGNTSAPKLSLGASPCTVASIAASLTLNEKIPSLPFNVPASPMETTLPSNIFRFEFPNQQPSSTTTTNTSFSGFGTATNTVTGGLFGNSFGLFNNTGSASNQSQRIISANGTGMAKYQPLRGLETLIKGGLHIKIQTQLQCITAMKEYAGKSLEELRLEDSPANQKRQQVSSVQSGLFESTPQSKSIFVATTTTSLFGDQSTKNTLGGLGAATTTGNAKGDLFFHKPDALVFRAPVSSASTSLGFSFEDPSTATAATTPKFTFSANQLNAAQQNSTDKSVLNFKKTYEDNFIEKFELSTRNANILAVVRSPVFKFGVNDYILEAEKLKDHLKVEMKEKSLYSLRTQPIMLVKLVSNKGDERSVVQHTRYRTEKLISWKELQNPENGFNYDDLIKIEVTIIKKSIDLIETMKSIPLQYFDLKIISVRRFCVEVSQISNLNIIWSPDILIHGVTWKVKVCKGTNKEKQFLAVYLYCNKAAIANFSYATHFSVKLISLLDWDVVEHHFKPFIYSSCDSGYGNSIIDWNDLFDATKFYVKNDKITLDIEINFDDPKNSNKAALICANISNSNISKDDQQKYKLTIENVDSLIAVKTPSFEMRNIRWDLQVYRHQDHLGVVLFPFTTESKTMVVELLSSKGEDKSVIQVMSTSAGGSIRMRKMITTWSELFESENGLVNNNSITLEVTISANAQDVSDVNKLIPSKTPEEKPNDCPVCYENMKEKGASNIACGHLFCTQCITNVLQDSSSCPICRKPSKSDDIRRVFLP